ncbi:MAG TPA: SpoIID/LytB domain-containing protein [Tepidisphaeraceae bacterium]|nr:SpoIID/LytB domain-containing protein [Tepidisphaeraceae bacterium]
MRYLLTLCTLLFLVVLPVGCSQEANPTPVASTSPLIRVLLLQEVDRADLAADDPQISLNGQLANGAVGFPRGLTVPVWLASDGWHIGRQVIRTGVLTLRPTSGNPIRVNRIAYRGSIRLMPSGAGRFNVINDVDVEDYLAGVVTREMYPTWPIEAIKAQAVASRTYALYEVHSTGVGRPWDVFSDERSQMYGGISGETDKSREAVAATTGIVLTYGPGDGRIFRAYFSSCCGGVSQAAADAFPGEPYIPPLSEQFRGNCCSGSKYFNWGPIVIKKNELARRIHLWAQRSSEELGRATPELNITAVNRIDLQGVNRYGRPNRVLITDSRGVQYSWSAEQLRTAVNTDAHPGTTLPSSFCKINGGPNSDSVTFYDGHGFGHGVGMCQWCAQARAAAGQNFEQILVDAYPQAKLVPAY